MYGGQCWFAREGGGEDSGMVGLESSTRAVCLCRDPLSGAGAKVRQSKAATCKAANGSRDARGPIKRREAKEPQECALYLI